MATSRATRHWRMGIHARFLTEDSHHVKNHVKNHFREYYVKSVNLLYTIRKGDCYGSPFMPSQPASDVRTPPTEPCPLSGTGGSSGCLARAVSSATAAHYTRLVSLAEFGSGTWMLTALCRPSLPRIGFRATQGHGLQPGSRTPFRDGTQRCRGTASDGSSHPSHRGYHARPHCLRSRAGWLSGKCFRAHALHHREERGAQVQG